MSAWIIPPVAGLIEPVPAPEVYIEKLGAVELIGGITRRCYYAEEGLPDGGPPQKVVKLWVRSQVHFMPHMLALNAQVLEAIMLNIAAPPIAPPPGHHPWFPRVVR